MSPRNEHHGLPRSHGGSCHRTNITTVDESRHTDWHTIVGHPTPDGLLRHLLLLHASRLRPSLPPGVIADGLSILDPSDFAALYEVKSVLVHKRQTVDGRRHALRHRIHRWSHMSGEQRFADQVVGALSGGAELPRSAAAISDDLQGFFQTTCPVEQLRQILLETDSRSGEIAWSKPLVPSIRSNFLTVLRGAKPERHTAEQQRDLLDVVYGHLELVERQRAQLKPTIEDLSDYQHWRQGVLSRRNGHHDDCGKSA